MVAGPTGGQHDPETVPASDRPAESVNWGTISLLLESAVFMLMGSLLRRLLDALASAAMEELDAAAVCSRRGQPAMEHPRAQPGRTLSVTSTARSPSVS